VLRCTGPPCQLRPSSRLVNIPSEVAANHASAATWISLTRPESFEITVLRMVWRFPLATPFAFVSTRLVILSRNVQVESPLFGSKVNMPRFVPAMSVPLGACCKVKTSRPSRPLFICLQDWPASGLEKTPPNSLSFSTPA
jgi:hypothetical protein